MFHLITGSLAKQSTAYNPMKFKSAFGAFCTTWPGNGVLPGNGFKILPVNVSWSVGHFYRQLI